MRLFLDSSVILAACGSRIGASRQIFERAAPHKWILIATPYVIEEVVLNLPQLSNQAAEDWKQLRISLTIVGDVFTLDRPVLFKETKDRPILFSVLAWTDVLLTLDRAHFGDLMDKPFYDLLILRPGMWLQRAAGSKHPE